MRIRLVLAGGLGLTVVVAFVVLLQSPATVVATNGVPRTGLIGVTATRTSPCQAEETLPADTAAIRIAIEVTTGPQIAVSVFSGSQLVTYGKEQPGWFGTTVTVPVTQIRRGYSNTTVCIQISHINGNVGLIGTLTTPGLAASDGNQPLPGRVRIEYMGPGHDSWWSLAGPLIKHMGLGRAASGTWIVLPITALAAGVIALASLVALRELR